MKILPFVLVFSFLQRKNFLSCYAVVNLLFICASAQIFQSAQCLLSILYFLQQQLDSFVSFFKPYSVLIGLWWAQMDSDHRPHAYQACALTSWAMSPCMVEVIGFEPMTPCLQGRCSTSWAIPPYLLKKCHPKVACFLLKTNKKETISFFRSTRKWMSPSTFWLIFAP